MQPDVSLKDRYSGWYFGVLSSELRAGAILPIVLNGKELVVYRARDGQAHATSGVCPHQGGKLEKGRVDGDHLRCRVHELAYDPKSGRCVHAGKSEIPLPSKHRLRIYPTKEMLGAVLVYDGEPGREPFDLPNPLAGIRCTRPIFHRFRLKAHLYTLTEDLVDFTHDRCVHGYQNVRVTRVEFEGAQVTTEFTGDLVATLFGKTSLRIPGTVHVSYWGPGFGLATVTFSVAGVSYRVHNLNMFRPLDAGDIVACASMQVAKDHGSADLPVPLRILKPALDELCLRIGFRNLVREYRLDYEQRWSALTPLENPLLSAADGPILKFRAWLNSFAMPESKVISYRL